MTDFQVDLTNCDKEPIHIPGQIQSHGFMIVIDLSFTIRFVSDNIKTFIKGLEIDVLGKPLSFIDSFLQSIPEQDILSQLVKSGRSNGFDQINPYQLIVSGQKFNLIISTSGGFELLEFEPDRSPSETDIQKMIGKSVSQMLTDRNLPDLLNNAAHHVKNIIQYDRVMIYRFAEDGHGEVVSEARNPELGSWLGHHYPASDIPKQARELYKLNLTRLIADVNTIPSKISAEAIQTEPLNLTWSQLRAVSPIHIQYLKNMGVASSFSISLIYKGELWGLVACHNYTPRYIDFRSRESTKLIGQILSLALEFRQDEQDQLLQAGLKNVLTQIIKNLQSYESIEYALTKCQVNILDLTNASGAALIYEKTITRIGVTPDEQQIKDLIAGVRVGTNDDVVFTSNLAAMHSPAASYKDIASGILLIQLSQELEEYVIWFKPERVQTIKWAGNPEKPVEFGENGLAHISPRHSFAVWYQEVKGCSEEWLPEELGSARRLREEINHAIHLKAGVLRTLNEKLKIAYEELDTFSYTISHDLKNPLWAIKSYAQMVAKKITDDSESLMVRKIATLADKMNFMIEEVLDYSRISRSDIIFRNINMAELIRDVADDLKPIYGNKMNITIGDTPNLSGDPLMLSQVFSNVISNGVKYSQNAGMSHVQIRGQKEGSTIVYSVQDNGIGIPEKGLSEIFDLFKRLSNVGDVEGSGVGLAIVKRIVEKHKGKVWVESESGKGTTVYMAFNS
jgi:chemotaxis family two-component system sensor kinase Cph1